MRFERRRARAALKTAALITALLTMLPFAGCAKQAPGPQVVQVLTPLPTDMGTPVPSNTGSPDDTPFPGDTSEPTSAPAETPVPGTVPAIVSKSGSFQTYSGTNVMRVDDRAYEICVFLPDETKLYSKLITETADALSGRTNVYDLIIPTAYGIMMPDDMRAKISYYVDLGEGIREVYSNMGAGVKTVSCYDSLMMHRDEFIYFRTDHHWTARGAYYAYEAFCRVKGVEPYPLDAHRAVEFPGFLGSLYKDSGNDPELLPAETVFAYYPVCDNVEMVIHYSDGKQSKWPIITDVSAYNANAKYMTFAGGDNPLTVFTNPAVTDGSVCIIIKESFGNALLPFLVDHYSKVYEVDYRYWKGNLIDLAAEVGASDMIFANNFMMISSRSNIGKLSMIAKHS